MALLPVRLLPSMTPPEMETCLGEEPPLMAWLAPVPELIWIVPLSSTQVLDCNVNGLLPTVKVPFRCSTMTLFGLADRAELYWLWMLSIVVEEMVRSVRPMPLTIVVLVCWSLMSGG